MSTLFVDTINEKTSGNGIQIPGHVVGYYESKRTNSFSTTATYSSPVELFSSSDRLTFSPLYSDSKLLVCLSADVKWASGANGTAIFVYRDGSNIGGGVGNGTFLFGYQASPNSNNHFTMSQQYMIDANSTSSTTFTAYIGIHGSSGTAEVGHWSPTVMSIMEIAQ